MGGEGGLDVRLGKSRQLEETTVKAPLFEPEVLLSIEGDSQGSAEEDDVLTSPGNISRDQEFDEVSDRTI